MKVGDLVKDRRDEMLGVVVSTESENEWIEVLWLSCGSNNRTNTQVKKMLQLGSTELKRFLEVVNEGG